MSYNVAHLAKLGQLQSALQRVFNALSYKTDIPVVVSATIGTTTGSSGTGKWIPDNTFSDYSYHYDIADANALATDIATITLAPGSMQVARECGLCSSNQTFNGYIRIYAKKIPTSNMQITYMLTVSLTLL